MQLGSTVESLEKPVERRYWKIGGVSDELGVAPSHVRYLETYFNLPYTKRTHGGDRLYLRSEIERLRVIHGLTTFFRFSVVKDLMANKELDLEAVLTDVQRMTLK